MNKQPLTELEFLNEKIKVEKQKVYRKGIVLLPGIATVTCGALATDRFGVAVGSFVIIAGLAITTESLVRAKDFQEKQEVPTEKVYTKVKTIINRKK